MGQLPSPLYERAGYLRALKRISISRISFGCTMEFSNRNFSSAHTRTHCRALGKAMGKGRIRSVYPMGLGTTGLDWSGPTTQTLRLQAKVVQPHLIAEWPEFCARPARPGSTQYVSMPGPNNEQPLS